MVDELRKGHFQVEALSTDQIAAGLGSRDDDELAMLFMACHPALSPMAQVALTLRTLAGLSTREIATGLLSTEAAVSKLLTRAKQRLHETQSSLELPADLTMRRSMVLETLYLLFNEGYSASHGTGLTRVDLCEDAIAISLRLAEHPVGQVPEVHALIALFALQASRLPARLDPMGELCLLQHQDRSLWNQQLIAMGMTHLSLAAEGRRMTPYHCEAAIAAEHARAGSFAETDWEAILTHYDDLVQLRPTYVVRLNRAVALAFARGEEEALAELSRIEGDVRGDPYFLLAATRATLLERMGKPARNHWQQALEGAQNDVQRRYIASRLR
jgi:RNA polymerase sigma-70 factor (ECF subfamily)